MLTVQPSSGLFYAVQYDGTNGEAIAAVLRATDYSSHAGTIRFKSFIMRTGGLLTSGHQFSVPLGHWIVWADEGNPYVIAPPLTPAEFTQQYQVAATAAEVAALSAQVTGLNAAVVTLQADLQAIDASQITSGVLPFARLAGTIAENQTVVLWNRPTLADPPNAEDSWQWRYNGVRTVYGNEYNLLRVRGVPDDQVPARFMSNFARDGLTTAIMQATLSDAASHLFQVLGNGDILAAGSLSMLPTAPVAVTFNAVAGTANAATITDGAAGSGTPYPVTTTLLAADNRVHLDGSLTNPTGVSITAQTTLFTVAAAHRPTAWVQFTVRTSTNLACKMTVKGATGAVCIDQALAAGATLSVDGANWRKA
jgi:hypothetical protein